MMPAGIRKSVIGRLLRLVIDKWAKSYYNLHQISSLTTNGADSIEIVEL